MYASRSKILSMFFAKLFIFKPSFLRLDINKNVLNGCADTLLTIIELLRFPNRTYMNHHAKIEIDRTILICHKLTIRAIRFGRKYGWTNRL